MKLSKAIKVSSVSEEYAYVYEQVCRCGGALEVIKQTFSDYPFKHDILTTECKKCRKKKNFVFDISNFFDKYTQDILDRLEGKNSDTSR